jgi:CheY-like chemotaxis protein/two-component sensor histidine kinase
MGYTDLALDELSPDSAAYKDIQGIQRISDRAASLTRQLLAFSRQQEIEPSALDLNELIMEAVGMLQRLIGKDIELTTRPAPNLGQIRVDANQLEQVLVNLVVNARDAMPNGGKLTIETANIILDEAYSQAHAEVISGEYVMLAVSDNGMGMSEEIKSHLFEPFFTTKEVGEGSGLGLATSFGIIKQSDGHLEANSEPGRGTTIKVYLPRVSEEDEVISTADTSDYLPGDGETILLVEDDTSLRYLTVRALRQQGYTVFTAANGNDALALVREENIPQIDLLITDIIMPQMGGKALAGQLKTLLPHVKILFVSGYANKTQFHKDMLEPGVEFLPKPFSPNVLVRKVREVLG